ncbi:MAG: AAA family ATPase [Nitrospinae bacterium]|nr:AAA family ATPase [Nitrospinota bacterium]
MRGIERIVKLKHPGVLRDFSWPGDMQNFGHYNLIYGWNGSGKTTISRIFRAVEKQEPTESDCDVVLSSNGSHVNGSDFEHSTLPIRVFNRDFVADSVFRTGGGEIPPIFVLGEENVEKQREVEQLNAKLQEANVTLEQRRTQKSNAEHLLDRHCIGQARLIKETLRSSGDNVYNNFDKANYRQLARSIWDSGEAIANQLSEDEREKVEAQHHATQKERLDEISYQFPSFPTQMEIVSNLLKKTVVSEAIQSLKEDQELSSWVRQGLGLHQSRHVSECLFCEQKLPENRLSNLNAHFSAEYGQFLESVDAEIEHLQNASEAATNLSLPVPAQFYDDLAENYGNVRHRLDEALNTTKDFLDKLVEALQKKKERVFESYALNISEPQIDVRVIEVVNEIIENHNSTCENFEAQVVEARQLLANNLVACASEEFVKLISDANESKSAVAEASDNVAHLKEKIAQLERDIVEHLKPAEELNSDIQKYLGHSELQLDVKDTGYKITRNGTPAKALSEGETTAIALLYFLKSLQDQNFDLANGVVVLDDPVSSLDANALYLAFGFIKERTKNAAQLFILTHNFTFFRQVRNWFHHLRGQRKRDISQRPARFYMLEWKFDEGQRSSTLCWLDPLLERYESDYHYLFVRIFHEAQESQERALEENYVLPNMARRLLEGFLAFRRPQVGGDLWNKLKEVDFDETKKTRILRFLHTNSHNDSIAEPEHDPYLLAEARSVLNDLLELMESEDNEHYMAMVGLVNTSQEEDDDE